MALNLIRMEELKVLPLAKGELEGVKYFRHRLLG